MQIIKKNIVLCDQAFKFTQSNKKVLDFSISLNKQFLRPVKFKF
jgi:hypothetical protein